MAILKILPGGTSGGFAGPGRSVGDLGKPRGEVKGWTAGASRRHVAFLWSVDTERLSSDGWALTLTMGGTPENADDWHAARKALQHRLKRAGFLTQHWVIEWTALGRPHLHMAIFGPADARTVAGLAWLDICDMRAWPAEWRGQHIVALTGATGWLEYVAKHSARGVSHYQREGAPAGWEKTGRLWGHWGDWPVELGTKIELHDYRFYRYRRLVTEWQRRRMLRAGVPWKVARMVGRRYGERDTGSFMGVSGWIPDLVSTRLLFSGTSPNGGGSVRSLEGINNGYCSDVDYRGCCRSIVHTIRRE